MLCLTGIEPGVRREKKITQRREAREGKNGFGKFKNNILTREINETIGTNYLPETGRS